MVLTKVREHFLLLLLLNLIIRIILAGGDIQERAVYKRITHSRNNCIETIGRRGVGMWSYTS